MPLFNLKIKFILNFAKYFYFFFYIIFKSNFVDKIKLDIFLNNSKFKNEKLYLSMPKYYF